jgi:hypothetical protein
MSKMKKKIISRKLIAIHVSGLYHGKENSESFPTRMRQPVTFGELSNDGDTTGTGSVRVVVSRVAVTYGCPASFYNAIWTSTSYAEKYSALGQQTEDYR